jgi:hypothetical protein
MTLSELEEAIANDPSGRRDDFLTQGEIEALEKQVVAIIIDTLIEPSRRELDALKKELETMAVPDNEKLGRIEDKMQNIKRELKPGGNVFEAAKGELIFFSGRHQQDGKRGLLHYLEELRKAREDLGLEC